LDFVRGLQILTSPRKTGYPFTVSQTSCLPVQTVDTSRWVLLTKKPFPKTLSHGKKAPKSLLEQMEIFEKEYPSHRIPTAWEAFLAIALHKIHTGEELYGKKSVESEGSLWTRCESEGNQNPVVGGHNKDGLRIKEQSELLERASNIGIAGIRNET